MKFFPSKIIKIGKDWKPEPLKGHLKDRCNIGKEKNQSTQWVKTDFSVPSGTKWTRTLTVEASQALEVSLETKFSGIEVEPKAVVKYLRNVDYSYTLVGQHDYSAYFPQNSLAYHWNWK